MTERLSDEQVAWRIEVTHDNYEGALAEEVQESRKELDALRLLVANDASTLSKAVSELQTYRALIPEVIEELEAESGRFRHWMTGVGCTPTEQRIERTALAHLDALRAIFTKLKEASQ